MRSWAGRRTRIVGCGVGTRQARLVPRVAKGPGARGSADAGPGSELPNAARGDVGAWGARVREGRGRARTNCRRRADEQASDERPEGDCDAPRETRRGGEESRTTGRAGQVEGRKQGASGPHHRNRGSCRGGRKAAETLTELPLPEDTRGGSKSNAPRHDGTVRGRTALSVEGRPCLDPTDTPSAATVFGGLENSSTTAFS